jgi:hypothetical protein
MEGVGDRPGQTPGEHRDDQDLDGERDHDGPDRREPQRTEAAQPSPADRHGEGDQGKGGEEDHEATGGASAGTGSSHRSSDPSQRLRSSADIGRAIR